MYFWPDGARPQQSRDASQPSLLCRTNGSVYYFLVVIVGRTHTHSGDIIPSSVLKCRDAQMYIFRSIPENSVQRRKKNEFRRWIKNRKHLKSSHAFHLNNSHAKCIHDECGGANEISRWYGWWKRIGREGAGWHLLPVAAVQIEKPNSKWEFDIILDFICYFFSSPCLPLSLSWALCAYVVFLVNAAATYFECKKSHQEWDESEQKFTSFSFSNIFAPRNACPGVDRASE